MTRLRAPNRTARDQVDDLIDWYEKHKPASGRIIPVVLASKALAKFATEDKARPKYWHYRNRLLHQVEGTPWE